MRDDPKILQVCPTCGQDWLTRRRVVVNLEENCCAVDRALLRLNMAQARLLNLLVDRAPAVVRRDEFMTVLFGGDESITAYNYFAQNMSRLRRRLQRTNAEIVTVPSEGYCLRMIAPALNHRGRQKAPETGLTDEVEIEEERDRQMVTTP